MLFQKNKSSKEIFFYVQIMPKQKKNRGEKNKHQKGKAKRRGSGGGRRDKNNFIYV